MTFLELVKKLNPNMRIPHILVAIDPGETTGTAVFIDGVPKVFEQLPTVDKTTGEINWLTLEQFLELYTPDVIVCENYRIYEHKLKQHTFSDVKTLRLIGAIDYLAWKSTIPIYYQMAQEHKGWCTDDKLKKWGFWQAGMRHSRDAIRAGCYYLLFNKEK